MQEELMKEINRMDKEYELYQNKERKRRQAVKKRAEMREKTTKLVYSKEKQEAKRAATLTSEVEAASAGR